MKKTLWICAVALLMSAGAFAQPCVSDYPAVLHIGESYCFQVCAFEPIALLLEGNRPGEENYPILVWNAGCAATVTNCAVVCDPALVPPDNFLYGGDPFDPTSYYGANDCFEIHYYHNHDATWPIEIFPLCDGCFCLTFDRQLAVNLLDFTAVAGNGEIQLNWSTASEFDNERFEIDRDNQTVATVEGAGNSVVNQNYSWTDRDVQNREVYEYKLIAISAGGNREVLASTNASSSISAGVVTEYALHQNFPNPFNPTTQIAFDLVNDGMASLKVFNLVGQQVATLVNNPISAGHHVVHFDGSNLASGVYLYKLEAGSFTATKKLVLLK